MDITTKAQGFPASTSAKMVLAASKETENRQRAAQEADRRNIKRDSALVAGMEASIAQKKLFEEQIEVLKMQNMLLSDNYEKLKEMYDSQVQTNIEARTELEKSKKYNRWMLVIAVVSMFAAIAGTTITLLVR